MDHLQISNAPISLVLRVNEAAVVVIGRVPREF